MTARESSKSASYFSAYHLLQIASATAYNLQTAGEIVTGILTFLISLNLKALEYSTPGNFSLTKAGEGHSIHLGDHWMGGGEKGRQIGCRWMCCLKESYSRQRLACTQSLHLRYIVPSTSERSLRDSKCFRQGEAALPCRAITLGDVYNEAGQK